MKPPLTQRQSEILRLITSYQQKHRQTPTYQEIRQALEARSGGEIKSLNTVVKHVQALVEKGYLQRQPHAARGLRLAEPEADEERTPLLPFIRRASSQEPERLRKAIKDYYAFDPKLLRDARDPDACLIATAGDDGMNGEGIRKGDLLVIEEMPWNRLRNGDLAFCLVREDLIARRFFFANQRWHLRPSDRTYTEETFPPNAPDCHIVGLVIGLFRRLRPVDTGR
jgi:repressor LexA